MKRVFSAYYSGDTVEDVVLLRLKVPRNERWVLVEFRAESSSWLNAEAYLRATGVIRGRQSTDVPQPVSILSTPVEQGEDISLEFSNFVAISTTCAIHLMVEINVI